MTAVPEVRGSYGSFDEAEKLFRQKVNMPTRRWDDLYQGQHARAFSVAGATDEAFLVDMRAAVDAAISKGETLEDFRARFDDIIRRRGWLMSGAEKSDNAGYVAWRTKVIYQTNLRTAYQAGRWETLKHFPYLQYVHNTIANPREQHKAWNGKIVATNNPWWDVHYPPNGWGCRCTVVGISQARLGKRQPVTPTDFDGDPPPEWAYNVGTAASGKWIPQDVFDAAKRALKKENASRQEFFGPFKSFSDYGVDEHIDLDPMPALLLEEWGRTKDAFYETIKSVFGAEQIVTSIRTRNGFNYSIVLDARVLANHVDINRGAQLPLILPTLNDPHEVWASFERDRITGKVSLRVRYLRAYDTGRKTKDGSILVLDSQDGVLLGWTYIPSDLGQLNKARRGELLLSRREGDN